MIYKFQSTDAGAPTLSGTVGHLINVLDACLINGYGSVAVSSMTRSGSVVTVTTSSPHGFYYAGQSTTETASVVRISGAAETAYNGDWKVASVVSTTVFTFNIGAATPATPATGSISSLRAPLGWTKSFSGTNKAAYRQPVGTNQYYLRVDDNSPSGGNAICAAARGYESMTDVDTGSNPFPTTAQQANGVGFGKSDTASSATRPWVLLSDGEFVWLLVSGINSTYYAPNAFGGLVHFKPGDAFANAILGGSVATSYSSLAANGWSTLANIGSATGITYAPRSYTQLGSSVAIGLMGDTAINQTMGGGGLPYPHTPDGGLYVSRVRVTESGATIIRGLWPGLFQPLHSQPLVSGDTVENITGLTGVTLQGWRINVGGSSSYEALFDLTGPWR